jgi:hypothetical protein
MTASDRREEFDPSPVSVGRARRFIQQVLREPGPAGVTSAAGAPGPLDPELADLLLFTANEVTTNAVLHGRTVFTVRVVRSANSTRIEVSDENSRMPQPCLAPVDAASGRGLAILDGSGLDWGVERHAGGKTVWVEAHLDSHRQLY